MTSAAEWRIAEDRPITEQRLEISARRCFHSTAESETSSSTSLTHRRLWELWRRLMVPPSRRAKIATMTSVLSNTSHVIDIPRLLRMFDKPLMNKTHICGPTASLLHHRHPRELYLKVLYTLNVLAFLCVVTFPPDVAEW